MDSHESLRIRNEKSKEGVTRVIRAFLLLDEIKPVNQYFSRVRGVDYSGKNFEGVFRNDFIKNGALEVRILGMIIEGIDSKDNWAYVKPIGGYFENSPNGLAVNESYLVYPSTYKELVRR